MTSASPSRFLPLAPHKTSVYRDRAAVFVVEYHNGESFVFGIFDKDGVATYDDGRNDGTVIGYSVMPSLASVVNALQNEGG